MEKGIDRQSVAERVGESSRDIQLAFCLRELVGNIRSMVDTSSTQGPVENEFFQLESAELSQYVEKRKSELLDILKKRDLNGRKKGIIETNLSEIKHKSLPTLKYVLNEVISEVVEIFTAIVTSNEVGYKPQRKEDSEKIDITPHNNNVVHKRPGYNKSPKIKL